MPTAQPRIVIDPEFSRLIQPPGDEEYAQLERNIRRAKGARDPLVLWGNILLDGHTRYAICRKHKLPFKTVQQECTSRNAARFFIIQNQLGRRNLENYARVELALLLEATIKAKAKERQRQGGLKKVPQISAEPPRRRETRGRLAALAKVSPDTFAKGKVIAERASEEVKQQLRNGELTINKVRENIRQEEAREARKPDIDAMKANNQPLDTSVPVSIILADPPWRYENDPYGRTTLSVEAHYPTEPTDVICAMPVSKLAKDDALLFMWATNPKLTDAMRVIEAWGFKYVTNMVWVKHRAGMGSYARNQHELLLIAKRGKGLPLPRGANRPTSVIEDKRKVHSRKPYKVYILLEKMYPEYEYDRYEMFARRTRKGWLRWGNQSEQKDATPGRTDAKVVG